MLGNRTAADKNQETEPKKGQIAAPTISLPKGGGAIRGIGEKFAASPVTGTGSMSVPIATSPGRSGFGPQLSLTYDSGAGNGPFGFGWSLSLPAITRKTEKGLPQYRDAEESDVFVLLWRRGLGASSRSERTGRMGAREPARENREWPHIPGQLLSPTDRGALRAHRALDEHPRHGRRVLALDLEGDKI